MKEHNHILTGAPLTIDHAGTPDNPCVLSGTAPAGINKNGESLGCIGYLEPISSSNVERGYPTLSATPCPPTIPWIIIALVLGFALGTLITRWFFMDTQRNQWGDSG